MLFLWCVCWFLCRFSCGFVVVDGGGFCVVLVVFMFLFVCVSFCLGLSWFLCGGFRFCASFVVLVGFVVAIGPKVNQVMVGKCLPEMCRICAHVLEEICTPKMPAPGRPRGKADPLRWHFLLRRLSNCVGQWVCAKYLPQKSHRKIAILGAFRENRGRPTIIFAKSVF